MKSSRSQLFLFSLLGISALLIYQNCSGGTATSSALGAGVVNQSLASKGMPVQISMNQLSFMSCANAGATSTIQADPLASPYYHYRFGAYNNVGINPNSTLPQNAAVISGLQPSFVWIPGSHVGGLSFTSTTLSYLNPNNRGIVPAQFHNYLGSNPFSNGAQPVVAIIYPNGARSVALAPTFAGSSGAASGTAEATTLLEPLYNSDMESQLVNTPPNSAGAYSPISYFENVGGPAGTLAGSLNFPINNVASLGQTLNQVLLFFGYSNISNGGSGSASSLIQNLQGPDGDPSKRLFGTGLQMTFTTPNSNNPSYFFVEGGPLHSSTNNEPVYPTNNQVKEFDLNPSSGQQAVDLTQTKSELWDCFHLDVVRDVDRKYWVTTNTGSSSSTSSNAFWPTVGGTAVPLVSFDINTGQPCTPTFPQATTAQNVTYYTKPQASTCVSVPVGYPVPRHLVNKTSLQLQTYYYSGATDPYYSFGLVTGSVQNIDTLLQSLYGPATAPNPPTTLVNLVTGMNQMNNVTPITTFYTGTTAACAPDNPSLYTPAQLDRLHIAQRFLPADQWEINITQNCAVPLAKALSSGAQCYLNGDSDPSKLIQYSASPTTLTTSNLSTLCGPGQPGECPATVSFCVRYQ